MDQTTSGQTTDQRGVSHVGCNGGLGDARGLPYDAAKHRVREWGEYPEGTKAHAIGGGHWYRTRRGWKWNGPTGSGSTFPTPGGDAFAVTLPGAEITRV